MNSCIDFNIIKLLVENMKLDQNEFFHCSQNPNLKIQDIQEKLEGFHITKDVDSALSRSKIRKNTESFMYKITLKSSLNPLVFSMDIFSWNSCTLARFILSAINNTEIGEGFDYDINDKVLTINDYIKDTSKLLLLSKYETILTNIMNSSASEANLKIIFNLLKSIGFNSIKYINQAEGENDSESYILFNNELIKSIENLNTLDKSLLENNYANKKYYRLEIEGQGGIFRSAQKIIDEARNSDDDDIYDLGNRLDGLLGQLEEELKTYPTGLSNLNHYAYTETELDRLKTIPSYYDHSMSVIEDLDETLYELGYNLKIKNIIPNKINFEDEQQIAYENINKNLIEDTRSQMTSKSRNVDHYKYNVRGKNRFERKKYSKVATSVQKFNTINMNDFFKKDILTVNIPVMGETDDYEVSIQMEGVVAEIARNIKSNQNKFEYRTVVQSLTKIFNTVDVKVKCTCKDFKYRYQHQLILNNNSVDGSDKDPGPGKTGMANTQGKGCKHILLCLANMDWLMKVASVIKNYITYMDENKHALFMKVIFPKLYNSYAEDAASNNLVDDETNLDTEKSAIAAINDWARNRGKIKAGTNVNPVKGKGTINLETTKNNSSKQSENNENTEKQ